MPVVKLIAPLPSYLSGSSFIAAVRNSATGSAEAVDLSLTVDSSTGYDVLTASADYAAADDTDYTWQAVNNDNGLLVWVDEFTTRRPQDTTGPAVSPMIPVSVLGSPGVYVSADAGLTVSNGRVSQAADFGGNARHFTQATGNRQPGLLADPDLPALIFDQDSERTLNKPAGYSVNTASYTVLMVVDVCNPTGNGPAGGTACVLNFQGNTGVLSLDFGIGNAAAEQPIANGLPYTYRSDNTFNYFGDPDGTADKQPLYLPAGRQVITVQFDGANDRVTMWRGLEKRSVTITGLNTTQAGGFIGSLGDFGAHFVGRYHAVVEWGRTVPDAELRNYIALMGSRWQAPLRRRRNLIAVCGDSITVGTGVAGCTSTAHEIEPDHYDADVFACGRSSQTLLFDLDRINLPGQANSLAAQQYDRKILIVDEATNDFALDGVDAAEALTRLDDLLAAAAGFDIKIGTTVRPRDGINEEDRSLYNAGLAARFDALIDLRSTPLDSPASLSNTDIYFDTIHPAISGRAYEIAERNRTLDALLFDPATATTIGDRIERAGGPLLLTKASADSAATAAGTASNDATAAKTAAEATQTAVGGISGFVAKILRVLQSK